MCASSHCKLISSILLFCYVKVRKLEEADALLEEQKHRSAEFCEGNPNLLASPRTFLYLKWNYLFLNELKDSPALCFEKLCLGASWMMDRIKELLFSGGIAGSFCSWWLVFLQSHLKEFFWLLFSPAADAYIQELSAENLQLKAQFEESDIQALQNRCTISFFSTLRCIASKFDNRVLTYDNMVNWL